MVSFRSVLGIELDEVSAKEKLVSALGGVCGMLAVYAICHNLLDQQGAAMLVGSIGASALLVFAVPHGQLSQPWPVLGGHGAAALVGVTCGRLIHNQELAAACAVGLAIGVMHQLKALHPPGAASALSAVVGGPAVHALGYRFVITPVLLNAAVIVVSAVVFNALFPWRRYPAVLARRARATTAATATTVTAAAAFAAGTPSHADVLAALRHIGSFVDITEADLVELHRLLVAERESTDSPPG